MPKCRLEILTPAWKELNEIADYYLLTAGPETAKKMTDDIFNALERLEEIPLSCPYVPDEELKRREYRMLVCGKYLCIYKLIGNTLTVYHIAHGASEYWKLIE